MKYACSVEVPLNREEAIALWLDESKLAQWQDGFQHKNWISGSPNTDQSVSQILLFQNGRKMELEESILTNALPEFIEGEYVHIHMTNIQKVVFEILGENQTKITTEVHYTEFNTLIIKVMAFLFPGMFKKQSQKWPDQFVILAQKESNKT